MSSDGALAIRAAEFLSRESARQSRRRRDAHPLAHHREMREECGVFGVIGTSDAAALTALGLHALQHRGQEGAGVASYEPVGNRFHVARRLGLVADNFSNAALLKSLAGISAVGHTRYSTQGDTVERNVQPLYADLHNTGVAIAHNGNLTNARTLTDELIREGCIFQSTSDSELFLQLMARSRQTGIVDRLVDAFKRVEGAYALAVLTNEALIGARDPIGIRPLVLGRLGGAAILASETSALDLIGAKFVRDVEPGEIVVCRPDGEVESRRYAPAPPRARACIFELIYFARPDSFVDGKSVYEIRKRLGARLAREARIDADFVAPIPDSGVPAAIGFAQAAGLPYEMALIRSHFVGRTFIEPQQKIREAGVKRKHSPNRMILKGKRVVLIDDSIVRGTTSRKIADMVRSAGAREVHLRVACPPVAHPDYYGINTPSYEELLAHGRSVEEMRRELHVDSLAFLSVDGLYEAIEDRPRDASAPAYTDHCFTGDYPTARTDLALGEHEKKVQQLSFLAEYEPL